MRRRPTALAVAVPAELAHFERWAALVAVEEVPGGTTASRLTSALAAHRAWCEARARHADAYGWPTGAVDRLREQRAVRLCLLPGRTQAADRLPS